MQTQEQNTITPIITPVHFDQKKCVIDNIISASDVSTSGDNIVQGSSSDTDVSLSPTCDSSYYTRRKKIIVSTTPPTVE